MLISSKSCPKREQTIVTMIQHLPSVIIVVSSIIIVSLIISSSIISIVDVISKSLDITDTITNTVSNIVRDIFHLLHLPTSPSGCVIREVFDILDAIVDLSIDVVVCSVNVVVNAGTVFVKSLLDSVLVFIEAFLCKLLVLRM